MDVLSQLAYLDGEMEVINEEEDAIIPAIVSILPSVDRRSSLFRLRWNSEYLLNLANQEGSFIAEYRVDPAGFNILNDLLCESLSVNEKFAKLSMSKTGSSHISTASRLGAALIMLGGGRRIEAMRTHGIAMSTSYANFHAVIDAINSHPALAIECDNSPEGLRKRSDAFNARSTHRLFDFCAGAIDGLAIQIRCPSSKKTKNQTAYFSGSKKFFCLNMQGVCDANCEFIAMSCKHVGSTNDAVAFETGSLKKLCENQQYPYHWNGDNAYTLSETMMIPFPGVNLSVNDVLKESFNFWHSQLRITIERTFGIFVQRFGIFWAPLKFNLLRVIAIVHACCRLHNFCVRRSLPVISTQYTPPPSVAVANDGQLVDDAWRLNEAYDNEAPDSHIVRTGNTLRDAIVDVIGRNNYVHGRNYTIQT